MQQLQGLDATLLFLESAAMPMHSGSLQLLALPPGARGRFLGLLREHVRARLPELPMLCRRLWWMPLNLANPAWVETRPDLRAHIVAGSLRRGAGMAELEAEVARLHATPLDRARPLWQIHVFEGLAPAADGQARVALFLRLHQAGFDAEATTALLNALMDLSAAARRPGARRPRRAVAFEPGMGQTLRTLVGAQAGKAVALVRDMPATLAELRALGGRALTQAGRLGRGAAAPGLAPDSPFNCTLSPARGFGTFVLAEAEVDALAQRLGATREEMLLLLCAGALRRHLLKRQRLPRRSLVAALPSTVPDPDHEARPGRRTREAVRLPGLRLQALGTHLADPLRRLAFLRASAQASGAGAAARGSGLPTDFPSLGLPWLLETASRLYGRARVAERVPRLANLVIAFVAGPSQPLYLAGARLLASYPAAVLVHGLGLNITLRSQAGALQFGIVSDAQALPDAQALAQALSAAWDDLLALPTPGERRREDGHVRALARQAGRARRAVGEAVQGAVGAAAAGATAGLTRGMGELARQVLRAAISERDRGPHVAKGSRTDETATAGMGAKAEKAEKAEKAAKGDKPDKVSKAGKTAAGGKAPSPAPPGKAGR